MGDVHRHSVTCIVELVRHLAVEASNTIPISPRHHVSDEGVAIPDLQAKDVGISIEAKRLCRRCVGVRRAFHLAIFRADVVVAKLYKCPLVDRK